MLIAGITAYALGIPVLKLKGHYLAMATMGFGIIIYRLVLGTKIFGEAKSRIDVFKGDNVSSTSIHYFLYCI